MKRGNTKPVREEQPRSRNTSMSLILDLLGPFVVHFCKNQVRINLPLCADHHANIVTDSNDIPLYGLRQVSRQGYMYDLEPNIQRQSSKCTVEDSDKILLLEPRTVDPIPEQTCHLVVVAPRPDTVWGLHPEAIWIHKNGASRWVVHEDSTNVVSTDRVRGLRFIYGDCSVPAITVDSRSAPVPHKIQQQLKNLDCESVGTNLPCYNITLRFSSNATTPDDNHQDAIRCFQSMRCLVPDTATWLAAFDESRKMTENISSSHPVDCTSPGIVMQDSDQLLALK